MEKLHIILLEILGGPRKEFFIFLFSFRNNFLFIIFFVFLSILGILTLIGYYFFGPETPRGIYFISVVVLFLGSTNLLFLSILSEYVSKILEETKSRPKFIIKRILNDKSDKEN